MSFQESLNSLMATSAETCKTYEFFENLIEQFYEECNLRFQEIEQYNEFCRVYKERSELLLKDITNYVDSVEQQTSCKQEFAKTARANSEELKKKEDHMLNTLREKEKQLEKVKDEIAACTRKINSLDTSRNKARLLRIITSTSFDYLKESNVVGYTIGNGCVKPFEYDLDKMSLEDVNTNLWNHLKKTYSEEYRTIKGDIELKY